MRFVYDSISTIDDGFFSHANDTTFFREDKLPKVRQEYSGSNVINSTEQFRQGVELSSDRSYLAGIVRFHSGEKGHQIKSLVIGIDDDPDFLIDAGGSYEEIESYHPLKAINFPPNRLLWDKKPPIDPGCFTTYVSTDAQCTYEHGQLKNVIEPLSIRPAATFMSTYYPHEAHVVWGNICGGNLYNDRSSEQVTNHYDIRQVSTHSPYLDIIEIKDIPIANPTGEYMRDVAVTAPFIDEILAEKLTDVLSGSIKTFSKNLEYNDLEIVRSDQRSCTNGFQYDGAYTGTDSISFGGLRY